MSVLIKPRPADPIAEHIQSRRDRSIELREIGGREGIRAIRERRALVAALKEKAGGRELTHDELDEVVECSDPYKRYRRRAQ
jgi:hypothetical protein